jgi:hypothetical protein
VVKELRHGADQPHPSRADVRMTNQTHSDVLQRLEVVTAVNVVWQARMLGEIRSSMKL